MLTQPSPPRTRPVAQYLICPEFPSLIVPLVATRLTASQSTFFVESLSHPLLPIAAPAEERNCFARRCNEWAMDSTAASRNDTGDAPQTPGIGAGLTASAAPAPVEWQSPVHPQPHEEASLRATANGERDTDETMPVMTANAPSTSDPATSEDTANANLDSVVHAHAGQGQPGLPPLDASSAISYESPPPDAILSPRHELELIPEDRPISTPQPVDAAIPYPLNTSTTILPATNPNSNRASAASTPEIGVARPAALRPLPSRPSSRTTISPISSPAETPISPAIVRTASTNSVLRHPVPDINARSGSYTSNIAALEATAERFSMTSSIEEAIRDNYNELKRSDSRRSSILAASVKSAGEHSSDVPPGLPQSASFGRQSSIVGLNTAARTGGYSPGGYIMSPAASLTGRLRSGSKGSGPLSRANSTRSKPETIDGEAFPSFFGSPMSRGGPGKGSVRSVRSIQSVQSVHSFQSAQSGRSGPLSLAEIAEMEPPLALTLEAMEEADRTKPRLEDLGDDEEAILSRAHQHVEPNATDIDVTASSTPEPEGDWDRTPMLDHSADSYWDSHDEPETQIRHSQNIPPPKAGDGYEPPIEQQRQATSGTPDTADEDDMFADFDGMHCDPDSVAEQFPFHPEETESTVPVPQSRDPPVRPLTDGRPQSYFDPESGQQMLYYPARVPAMLNLPPKLGKGLKAKQQERMARRSEVLSQMPKASKESRIWLPDPLENESPINFMGDDRPASSHNSTTHGQGPDSALAALEGEGARSPLGSPNSEPAEFEPLRRPPKLTDSGARKSRMNLSDLPPQLRASAFFDMPSETPKIVIKDGSATATLDSILNAAASAPVNAFTDHAYGGHLGSEVYGTEKKKNRKSQMNVVVVEEKEKSKGNRLTKTQSTLNVNEVQKRKSVWSLLPGRSRSKLNLVETPDDDASSKVSGSRANGSDSASDADERSALAPDEAEVESDSDDELVFDGPPTTLLAELQMRKRQHKKRIRNPLHNGEVLHSTLLERDAVAQMEARTRQKKKVNLAWATNGTSGADSDDDEDVPLGLLAAKKQIGPNATERDLAIAAQELNRPLGLMEKRELEENEPLSRRRNRLQGKPVPIGMYLQPSGNATRLSVMPGNNSGSVSPQIVRSSGPSSPALPSGAPSPKPVEEDIEGETLGERMKRLRAKEEGDNPLPSARPISRAFTEELLGQLGLDKAEEKGKEKAVDEGKGKGKANAVPGTEEEEETLGQRRRRLQAEREARDKEMGIRAVSGGSDKEALARRLGMADVLGANPLSGAQGMIDPREAERRRKEEEAIRAAREQDVKMRAFRAQVPSEMGDPRGGVVKAGGYAGGRFNDNTGGLVGSITNQPMGHKHQVRASISMGQLNNLGHAAQGWTGPAHGGTNLIGAAGNYGNATVGPDGLNPVFAKTNPFGNGYSGGFMQQMHNQQPGVFANGSLLAAGGYGAFGGGIGAAGGYSANQTAYGAGVGFAGGMHPVYNMQGGMPMVGAQGHSDRVERWRQSIR